jgi:hypothetical protein
VNYVHLLLDLLAVIGGSSMISLLSPWKVQARAVPALLFAVGLVVMALPMMPVAALAMMLPVAWLQRFFGIDLTSHEAADYSPATAKARAGVQAARERIRKPKPIVVTEFATKAYGPDAGPEEKLDDSDDTTADELDEPELSPAEQMQDKLEQAAQGLPDFYRHKLAGQRPGKLGQAGLRSGATRSFVPSLLG